MDLCNIQEVKALLGRHGFHFSKSLGQNFLIESWVPQDIATSSGADKDCGVLEIGPGIGPLTRQLAQRAGKVVALELDRSLLPILEETLADCPNIQVVFGDVTKTDVAALVAEQFGGLRPMVCANLPYNITTPVINQLLEAKVFSAITVMIQKEVAQRICAAPGTGDFGAFSLLCQYHAKCEYLFEVPRECFLPAPKVTSAVVRLTPLDAPPVQVQDEAMLFRVIRASFAQRRKTLLNGLSSAFAGQLDKSTLIECLEQCDLPASVRGETLSLAQFAQLADAILSAFPAKPA
jgi:16S rRNA (adenine1518-N6/adenine1519-N6)-dimethyltransferase